MRTACKTCQIMEVDVATAVFDGSRNPPPQSRGDFEMKSIAFSRRSGCIMQHFQPDIMWAVKDKRWEILVSCELWYDGHPPIPIYMNSRPPARLTCGSMVHGPPTRFLSQQKYSVEVKYQDWSLLFGWLWMLTGVVFKISSCRGTKKGRVFFH